MRYTDELYPANIARCQHIKVNGTLCGSPALKNKRQCFFHHQWQQNRIQSNANQARRGGAAVSLVLPILEDANSIQVALMHVMSLLLNGTIEHKTAALLLYALQTASSNLPRTEFKPHPEEVVIDRQAVADTILGDKAWYKQEFIDLQNEEENEEDSSGEDSSEEEDGTIQAVACPAHQGGCPTHPALCDGWDSAGSSPPRSTAPAALRRHPETHTKRPQGSEYLLRSRRYSGSAAPLPIHRADAASGPGTAGRAPRTGR